MPAKDPLFELIKSLTQGEKRHFSIYAKRHVIGEKNNYKLLFDVFDKLEEYNESKILNKFKGQKIAENFAVSKHQLYHMILDSLKNFHADKSIDAQLRGLQDKISILFNKGLIKQCKKLIYKARKLAQDYERHTVLLEIIWWERKLHSKDFYKDMDGFLALSEEEKEKLAIIENTGAYVNLHASVFTRLMQEGRSRDKTSTKEFEQLLKDPLLSDENRAKSYFAKVLYHSIHANYYDSIGNDRNNHYHNGKLVELAETNAKMLKVDFNRYITLVDNFCISGIRLRKFDECHMKLEQLKELYAELRIEKSPSLEARIFTTVAMHELCMFYRQGKFEKGLNLVASVEKDLETHSRYILTQRKHDLMYDLFYIYFGNGDYKKALFWLNKCLNDVGLMMRPAEISSLKILEIIVHYEIGNHDLVSFLVRNAYRFLLSKGHLFASEELFLRYIRTRLIDIYSKADMKSFFEDLRDELSELQKNPYERKFLDPFDMLAWLESKVAGKPFGNFIR